MMNAISQPKIEVRGMDLAYGSFVVMRDLKFSIKQAEIMIIMGGSGCGKSTLLKHLIGLIDPVRGDILYDGVSFVNADLDKKQNTLRTFGVLYQAGALWSSMTLEENVALPLEEYTKLSSSEIREIVSFKLSLVGLKGFEAFYPSEISGGMRKPSW